MNAQEEDQDQQPINTKGGAVKFSEQGDNDLPNNAQNFQDDELFNTELDPSGVPHSKMTSQQY